METYKPHEILLTANTYDLVHLYDSMYALGLPEVIGQSVGLGIRITELLKLGHGFVVSSKRFTLPPPVKPFPLKDAKNLTVNMLSAHIRFLENFADKMDWDPQTVLDWNIACWAVAHTQHSLKQEIEFVTPAGRIPIVPETLWLK